MPERLLLKAGPYLEEFVSLKIRSLARMNRALESLFGIDAVAEPIDPAVQTRQLLVMLIRRLFFLLLILSAVILPASLLRLPAVGWHPSLLADLAAIVVVLALLLLRNRLSPEFVGGGLLAALLGVACVKLLSQGLSSIATPSIMVGSALCAIFFGLSMAITYLVAGLLLLAGIGVAVCGGAVELAPPPETYVRSGWFWVANGAGLALMGSVLVMVISALKQRLFRSLSEADRRARESLAREKLYELLEQNMDDCLFVQDDKLRILYVSPRVEQLSGYTPEELSQLGMDKIMTPESLELALRDYSERWARANDDPSATIPLMEYEYLRKDGSRFMGELHVRWLRDSKGKAVGCVGVIRDVTERRRALEERRLLEERLRQAEKMEAIGQLAGGIAHDFNNHLGGILGAADCLRLDAPEGSQSQKLAELIVTAAKRAADLTRQLLVFSRRQEPHKTPLSAGRLVDETVALLRPGLPPDVVLRVEAAKPDLWISGEAAHLESALLNLGINARDAVGKKGEIVFSFRRHRLEREEGFAGGVTLPPGSYVQIGVRDTGEGMSEETQRKLFTPFFTTKKPGMGTGLGLAAVFGVVRSHGGGIRVESRVGQGSCFELFLPALEPLVAEANTSARTSPEHRGQRVILVEDNPMVREATSAMLSLLNHQVVVCASPADALDAVSRDGCEADLVLMDVNMPGLSGIEAAGEIHRRSPSLRVLLVSGRPLSPEDAARLPPNVCGYLAKPYSLADLEGALARVVSKIELAPRTSTD